MGQRKRWLLFLSLVALMCPLKTVKWFCLFFGVGMTVGLFRRSLKNLLRLHPDRATLTALVTLLYVCYCLTSSAVGRGRIGPEASALLLLMALTGDASVSTTRESLCFSLALITGGLTALGAICITGHIQSGLLAFYWVLYGWAFGLAVCPEKKKPDGSHDPSGY